MADENSMPGEAEVELWCGVYGEGTVFSVKIAREAKVSALQEKIAGILSTEQHTVPPKLLTLYLTRKKGGTTWMKHDSNTESFLQGGIDTGYDKMLSSWKLNKKEYLGPNFTTGDEDIHVLVELPVDAFGYGKANEPPNKIQRLERNRISFAGPLHRDECAVPFDTIDAFRQIQEGLSRKEAIGHPLFFLYGPRQFGKTTIAYRIMDWIASDSNVADVKCVFFEMHIGCG
ncbi:hypothetical protein PF008_g1979 [Phytophthora fragariae]|uniref:Crinkler effector protein N-terminal domain-containing protein n=1 Tax=Phytophthora fragariae TaxID=53985 RepID=A0A6G0SIJ0_9STRA|nr:hypothetical protein PF008_g1979 [Phytophthora fragariae]